MTQSEKKSASLAQNEAVPSPRRALRKDGYHHGALRAGLIEATRRLVEEKGPDGFSVSDACRLAGVSTAAPYKHFKNREEMLFACTKEAMERHREQMAAALDGLPEASPLRIKALGLAYVNFALTEPGMFRLKFGGFNEKLSEDELLVVGQENFNIVLREVAACLGETEITAEVQRRGFALWSFVHGLSFLLLDPGLAQKGGDFDLDAMLEDVSRRMITRETPQPD